MVVREARAPARDEVEERGWRERHRRVARAAVEHGRLVSREVPRLSAVASIMVRGGDVRRDGKRSERRLGGAVRRFRPSVLSSSLCHSRALVISNVVAFVFVIVSWGRVQFFTLREGLSLNRKRRRLERERSRVERVGPRGRRRRLSRRGERNGEALRSLLKQEPRAVSGTRERATERTVRKPFVLCRRLLRVRRRRDAVPSRLDASRTLRTRSLDRLPSPRREG